MEKPKLSTLAARKKTVLVLLFITYSLLISNCYTQPLRWLKTYDSGYGLDDRGLDICRSSDGQNFYVVGDVFINGSGFCIGAMKINAYGDTLWFKIIGIDSNNSSFGLAVAPTPDGGCVVTGNWDKPFTLKFNSDGSIGWFKEYTATEYYASIKHIEPTSDGGYIACGRGNGAYILKINSTGDLIWQRDAYVGYTKENYWVTEAIEGGYLTLSDSLVIPPFTRNIEITKWDVNGNISWKKIYPEFGTRVGGRALKRISNGYVLFGDIYDSIPGSNIKNVMYFSKLDLNYNTNLIRIIRENKNVIFSFANVINDNRFIFGSYSSTPTSSDTNFAFIRIIDSSNTLLHHKTLIAEMPLENGYFFRSNTAALNGDILTCGWAFLNNYPKSDIFLMRIDSNLVYPIGIEQIGNTIPSEIFLHQNYPNPFNPTTTIEFSVKQRESITLKIYNLLGEEVTQLINSELSAGDYKIDFNGGILPSGIYYYTLTTPNVTIAKKMVLVK